MGDRSVARQEPEWDSDERGLMLALAEVRRGECVGCGEPLDESTDIGQRRKYVIPAPSRCYACTALGGQHDKYGKNNQPQALRFRIEHREG